VIAGGFVWGVREKISGLEKWAYGRSIRFTVFVTPYYNMTDRSLCRRVLNRKVTLPAMAGKQFCERLMKH
jgi:hypothetical protein